ncbi:MAG TPA: AAA family ATPase [Rugosimonospora sp.]|nr:AAA family ATPase [Rugosimonospora sp.]
MAAATGQRPLVGRAHELDQLVGLVRHGRGQLVCVSGEPGIGKTRLLRELAAQAAAGADVLWGGATEFESELPFAAFRAALEDTLSTIDERIPHLIDAEHRTHLRVLCPELPVANEPAAPVVVAERFRLYDAVRVLLERWATARPVVLVLDDMHWADEGSVELCLYLLHHPPRGPVVLALAYRPRQVSALLVAAVTQAAPRGGVTVLELGPLRFEDADVLLPSGYDRSARERIYRLSEGNPLYLESLARSQPGPATGWPADTAVAAVGVVDTDAPVQHAVRREVAALDPTSLLVLRTAAIVGDVFEPTIVAEVALVPDATVLSALDDLVARDLVRATGVGSRHQFRHPLVRNAAYQSAPAGWRTAGHALAVAALRRRGAPATNLAHHIERTAQVGDQQAIAALTKAADAALHTAPAAAAQWLRAALRLLPEQRADPSARLSLLLRLARALGITGRLVESREVLREVLSLLPPPSGRRAQAAVLCASLERLLGRYAEANAMLRAELDSVADGTDIAAVLLRIDLAVGSMYGGQFVAERDWTAEALAAARRLGDQPLLAAALAVRALGILLGVRVAGMPPAPRESALDLLTEAGTIVDCQPDRRLVDYIDAVARLGFGELIVERFDDAERHMTRMLRAARVAGRIDLQTYVSVALGMTFGRTGRLRQALACFDDAVHQALLTGSREQRGLGQASRAWILAWTDDLSGAAAAADEAVELADKFPGYFAAVTRYRAAEVRNWLGDPDGCAHLLLDGCGGPDLTGLDPVTRLRGYAALASAEVTRGRGEEALHWAQRARALADELSTVSNDGFADLAMAGALTARYPIRALGHADAAVEAFGRVGDQTLLGCAHLAAARALAGHHDPVTARVRFGAARTVFAAVGADHFLRLAEREQRRMNAHQPRRRRQAAALDGAALTPRELEIAELVAAGLTNRQIAEQLLLSTRTVESHVARLFTGLDVSTRAAVVHALRRIRGGAGG